MKSGRVHAALMSALIVTFGASQAWAQTQTQTQTQAPNERERIAAERAAANARFAEQDRACEARFAVTSCVDEARREQRATLARLHRAELLLDDSERRQAAASHRQEMQDRAAVQESRASEPDASAPHESTHTLPEPNPAAPMRPQRAGSSPAEKRAEEQRNEARFAERARAAQAHREAVEARNARRAADGNAAKPLPLPSPASAP